MVDAAIIAAADEMFQNLVMPPASDSENPEDIIAAYLCRGGRTTMQRAAAYLGDEGEPETEAIVK